jgi:sarcosine oxidase subunit beta
VLLSTPQDPALHIACGAVVNCAGPFASATSELMLRTAHGPSASTAAVAAPPPLVNEIHAKAILRDLAEAVPPEAPMTIFEDEVVLEWSDEEKEALASMGGFEATLVAPLPAGAHYRPYPGSTNSLLMLWEALHMDVAVPEPPPESPELRGSLFAELLLRGLAKMSPGLGEAYLAADGSMVASVSIDGGYYTKTPDNLPLIGPLSNAPKGAYMCAGLSGYGVMAANAAGDLLAAHVAGEDLPRAYSDNFLPERWSDQAYSERVASGAEGKGLQI